MHLHIQAPVDLFQVSLQNLPAEQLKPGSEQELLDRAVHMALAGSGAIGFT